MEATAPEKYPPGILARPPEPAPFEPPAFAEPPDDALVRRAQAGDRTALETLTQRYRNRVYAFALGLLLRPDDAEDVVQETFIRVCRTLDTYQPRGRFRSWVFRIAANLCRDHCRSERRRQNVAASESQMSQEATSGPEAQVTIRTAVMEAIARLPIKYRELVALHYLEDLSPAEIAEILGRSGSAVRVQLWRARSLLAKELAEWLE
jgi:RNA polymerase sigma-70 factor (ECF subfamily)